jgi:ribulose-phosphate 3-epimerase
LEQTEEAFREKFKLLQPYTDRIHLDICDGSFTGTKTISGFQELINMPNEKKWDIHLMIKSPERIMSEWYKTGAERFIFHVEVNHVLQGLVEQAHLNGKKVGAALNPETPIEILEEAVEIIDFVHFLTVNPGAQGSPFLERVISKVSNFHENHPEMPISVDGGINPETGMRLAIAGATNFVVGSYIFKSESIEKAFNDLKVLNGFGD